MGSSNEEMRGQKGWRILQGAKPEGQNKGPSFQPLTSPWPKKVLCLPPDEQHPEALAVLEAEGDIVVIEGNREEEGKSKRLGCLEGERALDLCGFPGSKELLVVVTEKGEAWKVNWRGDAKEGGKMDKLEDEGGSPERGRAFNVRFKSCVSGEDHLILVDRRGGAWSWGKGPQTGMVKVKKEEKGKEEEIVLRKIDFFQGMKINSISAGKNFNLALVERFNDNLSPVPEDSGLPGARKSCPLGLMLNEGEKKAKDKSKEREAKVEKETEETEPPDEEVELRPKRNTIKAAEEAEGEESQEKPATVERLAQSGMYINPTDAIKYLSNQLSWVGKSTGNDGSDILSTPRTLSPDAVASDDASAPPAMTNLYRATTSAVADSVKYVGQTVSRLSYSFSTSTEKEPDFDALDSMETVPLSPMANGPSSPLVQTSHTPVVRSASTSSISSHRRSQSASMLDRIGRQSSVNNRNASPVNLPLTPVPKYDVFFWGVGTRGQTGQGDMLDRLQPIVIDSLSEQYIQKVVCGDTHCLALTLSGQVFGWGDNSHGQASQKCQFKVCSSPTLIDLPVGESACDIAVSGSVSYVLSDCGTVYCLGTTTNKRNSIVKFNAECGEQESVIPKYVMGCGPYVVSMYGEFDLPLCNFKSVEKLYLQKLNEIFHKVVEPLCSKSSGPNFSPDQTAEVRDLLMSKLESLLSVVSQSVANIWNLYVLEDCDQMNLVKDPKAFEKAFRDYNKAFCDSLVSHSLEMDSQEINRFSVIIVEILQRHCHVDTNELKEDPGLTLIGNPLNQLEFYQSCFKSMIMAGRKQRNVKVLKVCDMVEKTNSVVKSLERAVERDRSLAQETKEFWEMNGNKFTSLRSYKRRILLNSKKVPVQISNAASFSRNWIILMNDLLVHSGYANFTSHPLQTMWSDCHKGASGDDSKHEIVLVMPEDTLTLSAPSAESKTEWYMNIQKCILESLRSDQETSESKLTAFTPPITRKTRYKFYKMPELKGATYFGNWMQGKMHGSGVLTWPDGRVYRGEMRQNQKHGAGVLEVPDGSNEGKTVYEGQWRMDKFEGKGKIFHANGDFYEGMLKEGKPQGQGIFKQGKFMGSGASVYIGEWSQGLKHGYGISDDIVSGEKYMGMWANDMKSGPGCVVTLDGVYYEGTFNHGKMTGKGLMLFEDETSYEGNFADAGVFSGQGCLTYEKGDKLEGSFYGNYNDGMKFNGTIYKNTKSQNVTSLASQNTPLNKEKIGQFSVAANRKWNSIFAYYHEILCLSSDDEPSTSETQTVWEQLAILINQAKNNQTKGGCSKKANLNSTLSDLEMIPDYYNTDLTYPYFEEVNEYLTKAFLSPLHPLHTLLSSITDCYNATYGGVRIHPRLLKHAVDELHSIETRLYRIIHALFPALPSSGGQRWVERDGGDESEHGFNVTTSAVIYPHILPRIHSSIFMLYALYYKKDDDEYWARIIKWNKHPDIALLTFLDVSQKFWTIEAAPAAATAAAATPSRKSRQSISLVRDRHFVSAIETLQQIKTKFTPYEKLSVILETFREVNRIGQAQCGDDLCWSMDDLFPVFQYIVVRARILQLGAEIHLIEDLMENYLCRGEFGIMFTTLQAGYYQILRESLSM